MKNITLFLSLIILGLMNSHCAKKLNEVKQEEPVATVLPTVLIKSPVYPLLIGKEDNPMLRVNIQSMAAIQGEQEMTISLVGTTDLKDLKAVKLYYTREKEDFSATKLLAETTEFNEKITLSNSQSLKQGDNYFWLAVTLQDDVNIDHRIMATITKATVNKMALEIPRPANKNPKRIGHALRQHQQDGIHTYRIPGLATTNKGTLIAVYDNRHNGSVDLQEDVDVGMSRSTDGGQTWESMKVIMDMGEWGGLPQRENGVGDPSILIDRQTDMIWVAALWLHGHPDKRAWFASQPGMTSKETGQFLLVKSEDDGLTWSEPINITTQIKKPDWHLLLDGPGKGIAMEDGTLVFPAQFKNESEVPHSTLIYSKDHGKTWTIGTGAKSKTTEAQVVELADHSLMLNMRDDRGSGAGKGTGARSVAITKDLGQTWTEHPTSRKALPEPVCMASLIKHRHKGQDLLLFSNPADQYHRQNMTIKISEDEGITWPDNYHTLIDEGSGRGYSCMTSIDENTIGIFYEGSQADLIFQRVRLAELKKE